MSALFGYRKPSDLPETIPVFPLDGALMLPRTPLPLNIFEPRYLNMIDDAIRGQRLIGMVQTLEGMNSDDAPALRDVGTVGRLTSFTETPDGRYLITLTGISRFAIVEELKAPTPYRQVSADFDRYAHDLADERLTEGFEREPFIETLRAFLDAHGLSAEWDSVESAPAETLVNSLAMTCPFDDAEKQALLEAETIGDRRDTLVALMEMGAAGGPAGESGLQ